MTTRRKPLLCRVGRHQWRTDHNDAGQAYQTCVLCGANRDPFTLTDHLGPA